ncbi:dihydroorotase [Marispirochaeta aestuarii]|uniref:Dihydroorotase n=1 Tax=Marispirochaeta aestuarii TaxID=1963862 RepID=A0A1Y1RWZ8_9SPIO|nr:dihydroorotase [Marispirochaeta aestuarii]ORC34826.1 dihydroorotase [Marispirochaeta aestuarii]
MELTIRIPDDLHLHLRQDRTLEICAPLSAAGFARALVMPNTLPPLTSPEALRRYREEIESAAPNLSPLLTFKIVPGLDPEQVGLLKRAGAVAGKYYPAGATTNAEDGFSDIKGAFPLFHALQAEEMVLSIHGEDPDAPVFLREEAFLSQVQTIIDNFPRLRIVLEHLSCRASVEAVRSWPERVAATITAHHLAFSVEDLLGGRLNQNLFCKPVLKGREDQKALIEAVVSGDSRFFFGSDSAPHSRKAKNEGAAGSFTSPVALPLLAAVFSQAGKIDRLEDFTSRFGAEFYRLPLNREKLSLRRESWTVPASYEDIVPLCAGEELEWRVLRA